MALPSWLARWSGKGSELSINEWRSRLSAALTAIGELIQSGDIALAARSCQRVGEDLKELARREKGLEAQELLGACYFDLGLNYRMLLQKNEAEHAYQAALRAWNSLAASNPANSHFPSRAAACKNHLGLLYQDAGLLPQAVGFFREALTLREEIRNKHPEDLQNMVYLGGALCNLGNVVAQQGDDAAALTWYHRSIDLLDNAIPGCDCGCRDMHARMASFFAGQPHWLLQADHFLHNALAGRAAALAKLIPDQRYRHVRCSQMGHTVVISILDERLGSGSSTSPASNRSFAELRIELLDAITFAAGPVILDLHKVQTTEPTGTALLSHLRRRLTGRGDELILCGISNALRSAPGSHEWDKLFRCYATVDAALESVADHVAIDPTS